MRCAWLQTERPALDPVAPAGAPGPTPSTKPAPRRQRTPPGHLGLLATALVLASGAAQAGLSGQTDTFSDGLAGWDTGAAATLPPALVASGGPAGAGDAYMLLQASGGSGPSSRLVATADGHWTGDYIAEGVSLITMDLANLGSTTLDLRLRLRGPGGSVISSLPVVLAPGSGWQHVAFGLDSSTLTGDAAAVLANVTELRLFHNPVASFPGPAITAQLGVDNISAVPEPGLWALMASGLGLLGWRGHRARSVRAGQR